MIWALIDVFDILNFPIFSGLDAVKYMHAGVATIGLVGAGASKSVVVAIIIMTCLVVGYALCTTYFHEGDCERKASNDASKKSNEVKLPDVIEILWEAAQDYRREEALPPEEREAAKAARIRKGAEAMAKILGCSPEDILQEWAERDTMIEAALKKSAEEAERKKAIEEAERKKAIEEGAARHKADLEREERMRQQEELWDIFCYSLYSYIWLVSLFNAFNDLTKPRRMN